jgi:hypothetical protein
MFTTASEDTLQTDLETVQRNMAYAQELFDQQSNHLARLRRSGGASASDRDRAEALLARYLELKKSYRKERDRILRELYMSRRGSRKESPLRP